MRHNSPPKRQRLQLPTASHWPWLPFPAKARTQFYLIRQQLTVGLGVNLSNQVLGADVRSEKHVGLIQTDHSPPGTTQSADHSAAAVQVYVDMARLAV